MQPDYTLHGIHSIGKDRRAFLWLDRGTVALTCVLTVYRQPLNAPAISWLFDRDKNRPILTPQPYRSSFALMDLHYEQVGDKRITTAVYEGSCRRFVRRRTAFGRKRPPNQLSIWPNVVLETIVGALTRRWQKMGFEDIVHPDDGFTLELTR